MKIRFQFTWSIKYLMRGLLFLKACIIMAFLTFLVVNQANAKIVNTYFYYLPIDTSVSFIGGKAEADYNLIYWSRLPTNNIKFYLLERSSSSSGVFIKIAKICSSTKRIMSFKDYSPKTISYYRLLAFDSIGDFTIYSILHLEREGGMDQTFKLISTKDSHIFYISYNANVDTPINLKILKENNRIIYHNTLKVNQGNNLIKLDLHFLPEGLYSIEIQQNTNVYQQQFAMLLNDGN